MRHALLILRKDVHHLWPAVAGSEALAGIYGLVDGQGPRDTALTIAGMALGLVLWLYAAVLVALVVHEDRLTGAGQFWLTRPYSWRSLLLAKLLFILLCLNLPVLLGQLVALSSAGLSPRRWAMGLFWRQVSWLAGTLLSCAVLAAVTGSLVEMVIAVLVGYLAVIAIAMLLSLVAGGLSSLGFLTPAMGAAQTAILALAAMSVCLFQYSRRQTGRARWILAAGWLAAILCMFIFPWGAVFELVASRSPEVATTIGQLSFDPTRDHKFNQFVPIHVTGVPDGMRMYSERIQMSVTEPHGAIWESGWDYQSDIRRDDDLKGDPRLLSDGAAPCSLNLKLDRTVYERIVETPVHLHVRVAFTLLSRPTRIKLDSQRRGQSMPDGGFCAEGRNAGLVTVNCAAPFHKPAASAIRFQPLPSGEPQLYENIWEHEGSTGPSPVFTIWESPVGGGYPPPTGGFDVYVETREAIAHFERGLDIPGILLRVKQ